MTVVPCEEHRTFGAMCFVELVENRLGWSPCDTEAMPRWKSMMLAAGKVNKKRNENPELYSWENLCLTVDFLARRKLHVRAPIGIFFFVEDAVARSAAAEAIDDVSGSIFTALTEAMVAGEQDWVERLARARGEARHQVLAEWAGFRG